MRSHWLQNARLLCLLLSPRVCSNSYPLSWCCVITSSSAALSPFAFSLSQHECLFQWVSSLHHVAKVLELQLQHQSFQWIFRLEFLYDGLVGSPWSPRDSQESSPAPQFYSISSLVLSLLYGPTLTSVHDYWKNHRFDYMTFASKMMSLLFNTLSRFIIVFLPKSKIFNFMVVVTVSSDFGAQENEICHCFHFFPFYLLWSDRTGCHDLSFMNVEFQANFSLSSFTLIKRLFSSSSLSAIIVYHLYISGCWCFSQQRMLGSSANFQESWKDRIWAGQQPHTAASLAKPLQPDAAWPL